MRYRPGDLVFLMIPHVSGWPEEVVDKLWGIVLSGPREDGIGSTQYLVFRSDGRKLLTRALYMRRPIEVTHTYLGEREGNSEGGKPDPDLP